MPDRSSTAKLPDRRSSRWTGQRAKRRAEFVEAAIAAIETHGPAVSTEKVAKHAGVARPQLYRHFQDAEDLHHAVGLRAAELIIAEMAPLLTHPGGPPSHMIGQAVRTLVRWLADHANLYRYLTQRASTGPPGQRDVVADIKTTLGTQLSALLAGYLAAFDLSTRIADPIAFGLVGFVESATDRWLTEPRGLTQTELTDYLSGWIWGTLDHVFRAAGVVVDPDEPLPPPPVPPA
ncbi:transcriptional regulator, TetR family [Amycolatopsis marina]|uniref:Transcriptional regulator, TetR family n=1 Tax=Amycolatopsis marina TaxID=490629 RepID=A0A1I1AU80_9PSEU|nr:TetR/AcrR family transcriptional regulator [Amycolatopsis marina]SFB41437.1 transcriptional regulator, TetR family [Amycolatopsis marina]